MFTDQAFIDSYHPDFLLQWTEPKYQLSTYITHLYVVYLKHTTNEMACLEGFKPPTFWVETKDSVQLSYRHIKDVQINEHQGRNSIRSFPRCYKIRTDHVPTFLSAFSQLKMVHVEGHDPSIPCGQRILSNQYLIWTISLPSTLLGQVVDAQACY